MSTEARRPVSARCPTHGLTAIVGAWPRPHHQDRDGSVPNWSVLHETADGGRCRWNTSAPRFEYGPVSVSVPVDTAPEA